MEQNGSAGGNPHPEWETFDDDEEERKDFSEKYDRDNIKERNKSDSWPLSSKVNGTTNANRDLTHSAAAEAMNETTPLCAEEVSFKSLFRQNWHPTIVYCSVFWSFGMCVAFLGPTLLDLGCQTSTDLNHMSWVFFAQLLCTLIGSIAAGYLVRSCEIDP
ncbi:uncharacterized protein LOC106163065 [Lingula anatina]|uniref:Uncharacterized protein LOC106163065 n=1 Tax=Lingula anatina TaxID=7574 RepID=A0A1S3ICM5_LINAN|nr:uncharacterized protein LOC106163065 [Lingula anatina]|eukprot:XP_013395992.1 uncharacterized protein LOC106163065 [Lingula anatina]